jgi:hypothetical protein
MIWFFVTIPLMIVAVAIATVPGREQSAAADHPAALGDYRRAPVAQWPRPMAGVTARSMA